jgi:hypothetical protein
VEYLDSTLNATLYYPKWFLLGIAFHQELRSQPKHCPETRLSPSQSPVSMDITEWYAVALGAITASYLLFFLSVLIVRFCFPYVSLYFFKYFFYPEILRYLGGSDTATRILRYLRGLDITTRLDAVLIAGFVVGNILCITIGAGDISGLIGRTGLMATVNLVPLALGGHMNPIVDCFGVRLGTYARMHRWLGRVAIIEGSVHSIMAAKSRKLDLHVPSQRAALIVSVSTLS